MRSSTSFFASKCSVPGADDPAPDLPPKENIFESLSIFNTSPIEVAKLCRDIKKSNGSHCGVPGKFLSLISTPISFPLSRLFNNLFEAGHFPEIFKLSHITALYKGSGLKSDKENYRGIHLLPTLSKVAESIMHSRLFRHYISNNIISDRQAAYLKGDSTTQQLLYIVNMIKTNWNQGNFTQGCFLDASAAFDRCWINGMLAKLEQIKVEGKSLDMFESYLTNRKICTVIDGSKSKFLDVKAGVPQGSRLGPLLWILYNQDVTEDLESECLLYADDTCLFAFGKDPFDTIEMLNRDLVKIGNWAEKWKVLFNAKKTKDMIFMKSKVWSNLSPPLILNGVPVSRVHQHKHLGLWLTPSLDWSKQVQQTCLRANGKLAVLRSCKFLDRSTLDMLYKITIRSVIEYGLVVYFHSLTQCHKKRLSQIQYRAAKLVTGALHFSSQVKLEEDLSWETISDRADFLSLCIFHKISLYETRPLIRSCMPKLHNKVVNTRSSNKYIEFKFQNDIYNKSFFPFVTKIYNSLDLSLRNLPNMEDFKVNLKLKYKNKKIKHYSRGVA